MEDATARRAMPLRLFDGHVHRLWPRALVIAGVILLGLVAIPCAQCVLHGPRLLANTVNEPD